ncbi:acyl-homoserine-lactone synthase [Jiella sp. M17.18]|uniref:acyl-homoserine-lactone synthase n=1 Tax=Jiella sp. M17.18 TaxID=3234247 RepID=UPI0034DF3B8A
MMHLITSANVGRYPNVMEDVWRFRHDHFVNRFGWEALRKADGREIDQFDDSDPIHLPLLKNGKVIGYSRLLRTDRPHLLSDVYPELMDGVPWPRSEDVFEWTRCVGDAEATDEDGVLATNLVCAGVAEAFVALGLRALIVQTHPKLVTRLLEMGWRVHPLNVPRPYDGKPVAVIMVVASPETVRANYAMFGIRRPVLQIEEDLPHPLDEATTILPFRLDAEDSIARTAASGRPLSASSQRKV